MTRTGSPLAAGQKLADYEILEKAGEDVYKARDARQDRLVALKVFSGADGERLAQEARTAAALQHPNIARIYEVARSGETDFVAMEYVAGRTLERALESGPPARAQALAWAREIAGALAAAHALGITHGHLNPRNVMVSEPEGHIKVLDFGIAAEPRSGDPYRAPEQVAETGVDARSDIYAFGLILERMLTGRSPGERTSGLGARLSRPALERVADRMTRRQAARRFQLMEEIQAALEEAASEPEDASRARRKRNLAATAVVVILLAFGAWWFERSGGGGAQKAVRVTSGSGLSCDPALSRDGKLLAYASDRGGEVLHIWTQRLPGGTAVQLTRGEDDDHQPTVSPDGARIAFRSERDGGGVYIVPAAGGEPRLLAKDGRDPRFSPDGRRVAYWSGDPSSRRGAAIYVIAAAGGKPRRLQPEFEDARYPVWSPEGGHLLFAGSKGERDWWVTGAEGGPAIRTGARSLLGMQDFRPARAGASGLFAVPEDWWRDRILFSGRWPQRGQSAHLFQIPISAAIYQAAGASHQITGGSDWDAEPSVAAGGRLVFSRRTPASDIWSLPLDGQGAPRRLTQGARELRPSISMDGNRLAFRREVSGKDEIRVQDLAAGKRIEDISLRREPDVAPLLSPGGHKVAYREEGIFIQPLDGGARERLLGRRAWLRIWCWFSDEKRLLCERGWPPRLVVVNTTNADEQEAGSVSTASNRLAIRLSPDDRWLALEIEKDRQRRIFVAPFQYRSLPPESEWIAVTPEEANDRSPCWSPDGSMLYFLSDRDGFRCIWARKLERATKKPVGEPLAVHHFHHARYALASEVIPGDVTLAAGRDKLVFSIFESAGSIWMLPSLPRLK